MYKAILFDLDGTLVKTDWNYRYFVLKKTISSLKGKFPDVLDVDRFWYENDRSNLVELKFEIPSEKFWEAYRKNDLPHIRMRFTQAYSDTDFIPQLKNSGYKLGIVTGAPEYMALEEIKLIGKDNFKSIISANSLSGILSKPHPEGLEKCMNALNVDNLDCMYVGNGVEDISAARNAGVLDVFIDRDEYFFPRLNPSFKINSLYSLEILRNI